MTIKAYQQTLLVGLRARLPDLEVRTEWRAQITHGRVYSPRLDLAIGPYALDGRLIDDYDHIMGRRRDFFNRLVELHNGNAPAVRRTTYESLVFANRNSRCLVAVEIENQTSQKHLMGSAINACALGRVGVVVGYNDERFDAFNRLRQYFDFLRSVEKSSFNTSNLIILTKDQALGPWVPTNRRQK